MENQVRIKYAKGDYSDKAIIDILPDYLKRQITKLLFIDWAKAVQSRLSENDIEKKEIENILFYVSTKRNKRENNRN